MENLNLDFLMSGKQFTGKLKENTRPNTIINGVTQKCVWSAKHSKSNNFYQIKEEITKLKDSSK